MEKGSEKGGGGSRRRLVMMRKRSRSWQSRWWSNTFNIQLIRVKTVSDSRRVHSTVQLWS